MGKVVNWGLLYLIDFGFMTFSYQGELQQKSQGEYLRVLQRKPSEAAVQKWEEGLNAEISTHQPMLGGGDTAISSISWLLKIFAINFADFLASTLF